MFSGQMIISWMNNSQIEMVLGTVVTHDPFTMEFTGTQQISKNQVVYLSPYVPALRGIQDFHLNQTYQSTIIDIRGNHLHLSSPTPSPHLSPGSDIDIIQRRLPDAMQFMENYNHKLFTHVVKHATTGHLVTSYGGVLFSNPIAFDLDTEGMIAFSIPITSTGYRHLRRSGRFQILTYEDRYYYLDFQYISTIALNQDVTIKGKLTKFSYGNQSNLETIRFGENISLLGMGTSMFESVKYWLDISRIRLFQIPLLPILVVLSLMIGNGMDIPITRALLVVLSLLLLQSGASLLNDYFDYLTETDDFTLKSTLMTGGSQYIQMGLIAPEKVFYSGFFLIIGGSIVGLLIIFLTQSLLILLFGLVGILVAYFYSGSPINLARRGLGELSLGITFGPLVMIGVYQALHGEIQPSWIFGLEALVLFFHISAIVMHNNLIDYDVDHITGKLTGVVRFGLNIAVRLIIVFLYLPILLSVFLVLGGWVNREFLGILILLPLVVWLSLQFKSIENNKVTPMSLNYGLLVYYHSTGVILILLNLLL